MTLTRRARGTPEPNDFDRFLNVLKGAVAVVGAIGVAGHPALAPAFPIAAEALNQVQSAVASRRSKELLEDVVDELYFAQKEQQLGDEQIQQIIVSEQFNSALLQARLIATRTHQEEKLIALRNAVVNTAFEKKLDDDRRAVFLSLIDRLTPVHMSLLRGLQNSSVPRRGSNDFEYNEWEWKHRYIAQKNPDVYQGVSFLMLWVRDSVLLLTEESESFIKMLIGELYTAGLITIAPIDSEVPSSYQQLVTPVGSEFLKFIAAPDTQGPHD